MDLQPASSVYGSDAYDLPPAGPSVTTAYGLPDYSSPAAAAVSGGSASGITDMLQPDHSDTHEEMGDDIVSESAPVVMWSGDLSVKLEVSGMFGARRMWKVLPCFLYEGEPTSQCLLAVCRQASGD